MHLEEMKREIGNLVLEKGFYNKPADVSKKLLFAFIELGEASDNWKKGRSEEEIAEELIDVIFYVLDASRLACPSVNMDETFQKKLKKNKARPFQYGEGHRQRALKITDELCVTNRDDWREWLIKNHDIKKEVWLIYYKKHTGKPSIPYDDSVEEAICFGWIDNIIKRIDNEKFVRKFTPRKAKSKWSELNKKRARKMIEKGKMTEAGLAKIKEAKKSGELFKTASSRKELVIPSYMTETLAKNQKALANFNSLAESYKRQYVEWISSAKRKETRVRRLAEAIKLLEKNEKLGMK